MGKKKHKSADKQAEIREKRLNELAKTHCSPKGCKSKCCKKFKKCESKRCKKCPCSDLLARLLAQEGLQKVA
jgi:hypothetical protein